VSRVRRTGYFNGGSWAVAENIAGGQGRRGKPRAIVSAWMHSSGHRRNILERSFRHIGVGVVNGSPKGGGGNLDGRLRAPVDRRRRFSA